MIFREIKRSFQELYGEFGIAYLGTFGGKLVIVEYSQFLPSMITNARGGMPGVEYAP